MKTIRGEGLRLGAKVLLGLCWAVPDVGAQVDADFTATPTSGTNPLTVEFTDTSTGGTPSLWFWSFGDGGSSVAQDPSHTYTTPGTHSVSLTVFDGPFVFDTETKTDLILVTAAPLVADFTATPTSGDNPLTVVFDDTSTGAEVTAWSWDLGDGTTSTVSALTHTYTAPGSYTVSLTAFSGGQGETVTKTDLIDVGPAPLFPAIGATPTTGMVPLTVSFTDLTTGSPPTGWLWDFGDGNTSTAQNPTHVFTGDYGYDVALTVFVEQQSAQVYEQNLIKPTPAKLVPDFTADTLSGQVPLTVSFTGTSSGAEPTAWLWNPGDAESVFGFLHEQNPVHTYTQPGTYDVYCAVFFGQQQESIVKPGLITVLPLPTDHETAALSADDGADSDVFGIATAVSGTRALVGAHGADTTADGTGAAYLFDLVSGTQQAKLVADDAAFGLLLGGAVALDGDLALVGAIGDNTLGSVAGAAYLFDAATGSQQAKLLPAPGNQGDRFGTSVALDGPLALISAPRDDDAANNAGAVYVFDVGDPAKPVQVAKLTAEDGDGNDRFGESVALRGQRVLVGAPFDEDNGGDAGSAYLFDLSAPQQPVQIVKLLAPDESSLDRMGSAVALTESFAIVGSPFSDALEFDQGSALVFDAVTGAFVTELFAGDGFTGQGFGTRVAASGARALIGAPWDDDSGQASGAAYLFDLPSGTRRAKLLPDDSASLDLFGYVALDGETAVIGAPGAAGEYSSESGSAYVFDVATGTWTDLGQGLSGGAGTPTLDGSGPLIGASTLLLALTDAAPMAPTFLVIGLDEIFAPYKGGVLVPSPDVVIGGLLTDAVGDLMLPDVWPTGLATGATLYFQHWIVDAGGPTGFAASNGLSGAAQ